VREYIRFPTDDDRRRAVQAFCFDDNTDGSLTIYHSSNDLHGSLDDQMRSAQWYVGNYLALSMLSSTPNAPDQRGA
jgi:hypothetical protein